MIKDAPFTRGSITCDSMGWRQTESFYRISNRRAGHSTGRGTVTVT